MKEHVTLRAKEGTKERLATLARCSGKRPYTLAGELLLAAIAAAEAMLVPQSSDDEGERAA